MLACNKYVCMNAGKNLTSVLPNFLMIGAQKSGTTSLFDILKQHSRIYLHPKKELHFFDVDQDYEDGVNFYASYFRDTGNAAAIGEATPIYLYLPHVPGRIKETLGSEIRLIAILRNPADRAFSQYKMMVNKGLEKRSMPEAFEANASRLKDGFSQDIITTYLDRGFYSFQIENYFNTFPQENIRVYLFEEDFLDNRKEMIRDIQGFLEVDYEDLTTYVKSVPDAKVKSGYFDKVLNSPHPVNQFFKRVIPSEKTRARLKYRMNSLNAKNPVRDVDWEGWRRRLIRDVFYEDIKKTEELIGRDLSGWYKGLV